MIALTILFNQESYIETTKGIIKEHCKRLFPDYDIPIALPDLADDNLKLDKPVIHIEFNSSVNVDKKAGRNNGRGQRVKRKILRFSFQILTTGEGSAILNRDRVAQKIEYEFAKEESVRQLASQGLKDIDVRHINSYRVREGVHLCRLELYMSIKFITPS